MTSVSVRGLAGSANLEVADNATIADVVAAAKTLGLPLEGLSLRTGGQSVTDQSQPVEDGQVIVASPPAAKHG